MQSKCRFGLMALALAVVPLFSAGTASARAPVVSAPMVHGNLAIYPIEGGTISASTPLTIGQASERGLVRIDQQSNGAVRVDNLSSRSIFVPFGTLLTGGTQDQVVALDALVPPNATDVHLFVFCVDPFRMAARQSESGKLFAALGVLIPSRMAQLSMLLNVADSDAVWDIRQAGVWWSIDTLRSQLEATLGKTLQPATPAAWTPDFSADNPATDVLSLRKPQWNASLPQALSDLKLRRAEAPYMRAFRRLPTSRSGITGAAFAIDGRVVGADIYRSAGLFGEMWPELLRAYATAAIAAPSGTTTAHRPSVADVRNVLSAAHADTDNHWGIGGSTAVRDTKEVLYAQFSDAGGVPVAQSYLPKFLPPPNVMTPDALVAATLERDNLAALARDETIAFRRDSAGKWSATISPKSPSIPAIAAAGTAALSVTSPGAISGRFATIGAVVLGFVVLLGAALLKWRQRSHAEASGPLGMQARRRGSPPNRLAMALTPIKRLSVKAVAIMGCPPIPSPAAVLGVCLSTSRVRRTP